MYGVKRREVRHHRIQDGKAILSIALTKGEPSDKYFQALEWVGDGYQLLAELKDAIRSLEEIDNLKGVETDQ